MKGNEVRTFRKRLNLKQSELADRLGVAGNTVARWERDEVAIPPYLELALIGLETLGKDKAKSSTEPVGEIDQTLESILAHSQIPTSSNKEGIYLAVCKCGFEIRRTKKNEAKEFLQAHIVDTHLPRG